VTRYEQEVIEQLETHTWRVLKRGWPDFMVLTDNGTKAFALEVKNAYDTLSRDQVEMQAILSALGVPTYIVRTHCPRASATTLHDLASLEGRYLLPVAPPPRIITL